MGSGLCHSLFPSKLLGRVPYSGTRSNLHPRCPAQGGVLATVSTCRPQSAEPVPLQPCRVGKLPGCSVQSTSALKSNCASPRPLAIEEENPPLVFLEFHPITVLGEAPDPPPHGLHLLQMLFDSPKASFLLCLGPAALTVLVSLFYYVAGRALGAGVSAPSFSF